MSTLDEQRQQWTSLCNRYSQLKEVQDKAHQVVQRAYADAAAGKGTGPTDADLDVFEAWRDATEQALLEMDAFIKEARKNSSE